METLSVEEATEEFGRLLGSGYYKRDRSVNTAEDYSKNKENRDMEAAIEYANSEDFKLLCIEEGFFNA